MGERTVTSLNRSKLNPPRMAADLVRRSRLVDRLERGRRLPLGLVCAPASYGKSTLLASWLEQTRGAFAWLSLDEADSDLSLFVEYFVAACKDRGSGATSMAGGACAETLALARVPEPRPLEVASCLVNELEELADDLVVVLDDYHRIRGTAVHDLMNHLLRYPPRSLHLEIVTRVDPPLPLVSLRAGGQMSEIRQHDLRFTSEETRGFFDLALDASPRPETLARLEEATEGWAVGLRLAALVGRGGTSTPFWRGWAGRCRNSTSTSSPKSWPISRTSCGTVCCGRPWSSRFAPISWTSSSHLPARPVPELGPGHGWPGGQ